MRFLRRPVRHLALCGGQTHPNRGALARRGVELDGSAMGAHDSEYGGHAESSSGLLGGEEWIEEALQNRRLHAAALVLHLQHHVPTSRQLVIHVGVGKETVGHRDLCRGQPNGTAGGCHGVRGVGEDVHHDLAELGHVRLHRRKVSL